MSPLIENLWQLSLFYVLVVAAVLLIQHIFNNLLSANQRYWLWLSVPLCLLASLLQPEMLNSYTVSSETLHKWNKALIKADSTGLNWINWLAPLWLTGFVFKTSLTAIQEIRFLQSIKVIGLWPTRQNWLGQRCQVLQVAKIQSPCLSGLIAPKILLPNGLARQERQLVLQHELSHFYNLDHVWNALAQLLTHIFWFMPFNRLILNEFTKAQEIACDARVLQQISSKEKSRYAQLLLKLTTQPMTAATAIGWGSHSLIKERITMMNTKSKKIGAVLALGFIATAAITALLVESHDELPPIHAVAPDWPRAAIEQGIEGTVLLALDINQAGEVTQADVVESSNAIFNKHAIKAVKQWKFAADNEGTYNYQLDFSLGE